MGHQKARCRVKATPAQWRKAFDYANRINAIEGVYPSEFGLQVQDWIVEGRVSVEDAVAMIIRHHSGRAQA